MRIAVVDDEPQLLKLTEHTLTDFAKYRSINIEVDTFVSGRDFLATMSEGKYDVVFMDVYMPEFDGVMTSKKMREIDSAVLLIFFTTSREHMADAFACHAFEYIVKPTGRQRLFSVMDECVRAVTGEKAAEVKYFEFESNHQMVRINHADIVSVSVTDHTVFVAATNGKVYPTRKTYSSVAADLSESEFFLQVNRGVLVNMNFIDEFSNGECFLTDGYSFSVKVRERVAIEKKWHDYTFNKMRKSQKMAKSGGIK